MSAAAGGQKPAAIILAAGKGTRMKSDLPKVCHPIGGRPMVCAVVDACRLAGCGTIVAVVGYKQELVREALKGYEGVQYAVQAEQLGTGHAVRCAEANFGPNPSGECFVLCGDGPLIRAETLTRMLERHRQAKASGTLATSVVPDATGYGRITRDASGRFTGIVEQKNATPEQLKIREINPSYYCFGAGALFSALREVTKNETTGEFYITDVPGVLMVRGERVEVIDAVPPEDVLSINTLEQLAEVDRIFRSRGRGGAGA